MKRLLVGLIISLSLGGIWWWSEREQQYAPQQSPGLKLVESDELSPSPFPFQEMTIPYLRKVEYTSQVGEREIFQETENYTSYLASYDSIGLRINGLLTRPKGEMPEGGWPAVVFVHGYIPPTSYQTTAKYQDYVDYLARNGLVVFKIDLRGHGESEGEPGGAYYSEDYVVDTLNAVAALANLEWVNEEKIGLWGHSMAGNVVFRAMVVKQDVRATVIWAGAGYSYQDLQKYGLSDNSYRRPEDDSPRRRERDRLRELYGSYTEGDEFWQQVVPTNYLEGVKGAIQLHHAVDDTTVNIGYSRDLMAILDESEVEHSLYEYVSGGHNIGGASFSQAMARTVEFYQDKL